MPESSLPYYCHPQALVETTDIGEATTVWAFVHILAGARLGRECNVNDHCFIEGGVVIGDYVTVKCGIYLWNGVTLEDKVFLGPNVVFTNDLKPRSKNRNFELKPTLIKEGASLGANSTVLAGVTVGRYALTGIASVITRDVPDYALVYGSPARQHGWVDEQGDKLAPVPEAVGRWHSPGTGRQYVEGPSGLAPAP